MKADESQLRIDGEYRNVRVQIVLAMVRYAPEDALLDFSISINTSDWSFASMLCVSVEALQEFKVAIIRLVETNEGVATLRSYTEESELRPLIPVSKQILASIIRVRQLNFAAGFHTASSETSANKKAQSQTTDFAL